MIKVLVVDDDAGLRLSVSSALRNSQRFDVEEAVDGAHAMERFQENKYNLVILDVDMPRMNGMETLKQIKQCDPSVIVLIVTAYATIDDAVLAVKEGAYNYISKPIKTEQLMELIEKALEAHSLITSAAVSSPILIESGRKFIGKTAEMQKIFELINRLSKVDTSVMIRGESGTGKELVARAIHFNSARKEHNFVAINCSAIPENLFESELFGHEKGAFTGADARKIGKFQYADSGTLFLDEVGDLPILMQAKLLRVLQEKTFTPVGSNRELGADVRIIAATNRPLEQMIRDSSFREDLFYRLSVIPVLLPALRERKEDVEHMVNLFIKRFNQAHGKKIIGTTPETLAILKKYSWPGNIRELENVIEYAFVLETTNRIGIHSLPERILNEVGITPQEQILKTEDAVGVVTEALQESLPESDLDFTKHKERFEKEFIVKALKTFKGRINQTALHANIPKKTLLRKMEKYGIKAKDYI